MSRLGRFREAPWRTALILAVLALAVYVPGCRWGVPHVTAPERTHAWGNDDLLPLAPLAEMYNTFVRSGPDRNVAYPWGAYAIPAAASAPYLAWLAATGQIRRPSGVYPFGLRDPAGAMRTLTHFGRLLVLTMAVLTVLGVYVGARALAGEAAGVAAALSATVMYPMAYFARVGNPDMMVLAWSSLALAVLARCLTMGITPRRALWFGVFVALAGATKDQAAGSFFLLVPVFAWWHWRGALPSPPGPPRSRWAAPLAGLAGFVPAYLLASGIPFDPQRYAEHIGKLARVGAAGVLYLRYPATAEGYRHHLADLGWLLGDVMSWPMMALAAVGVAAAWRTRRASLVLLLSSLGFILILLPVRFSRIHYLLPVALPLCYFVGLAVAVLWRASRVRAALALAAGLTLPLLWTVDLTHDMLRDSRYAAGEFLARAGRPGDVLVSFGAPLKLPHLSAGIRTVMVDARADALPTLLRERPAIVVIGPEDTDEGRRRVEWRVGPRSVWSAYVPDSVVQGLADGRLGYRLVGRFQSARLMPWLSRPFLSYGTVNPPVLIFLRDDRAGDLPRLDLWTTAPHYPPVRRVDRLTVEYQAGLEGVNR